MRLDDGRSVALRGDVAAKHGLRVGEQPDSEVLQRAAAESNRREAWRTATRYLASRARSEQEVRARLQRAGFDAPETQATIERLHALRYLDDAAFAVEFIESRVGKRARGRDLVELELRAKGVAAETASSALDLGYGDEIEVARPLAEAHAERLGDVDFATFRCRLGSLLSRRGFAYDTADTLVRELWEDRGRSTLD